MKTERYKLSDQEIGETQKVINVAVRSIYKECKLRFFFGDYFFEELENQAWVVAINAVSNLKEGYEIHNFGGWMFKVIYRGILKYVNDEFKREHGRINDNKKTEEDDEDSGLEKLISDLQSDIESSQIDIDDFDLQSSISDFISEIEVSKKESEIKNKKGANWLRVHVDDEYNYDINPNDNIHITVTSTLKNPEDIYELDQLDETMKSIIENRLKDFMAEKDEIYITVFNATFTGYDDDYTENNATSIKEIAASLKISVGKAQDIKSEINNFIRIKLIEEGLVTGKNVSKAFIDAVAFIREIEGRSDFLEFFMELVDFYRSMKLAKFYMINNLYLSEIVKKFYHYQSTSNIKKFIDICESKEKSVDTLNFDKDGTLNKMEKLANEKKARDAYDTKIKRDSKISKAKSGERK